MIIRPATTSDAQAIASLWNPFIRDSVVTFNSNEKSCADIAQMIVDRETAGQGVWVAESNNQLVGFVTFFQFRSGIGYRHSVEHTIVIAPGASGTGVGRALMAEMEKNARAYGAHAIIAGVAGENEDGRRFHIALGYEEIATLPEVGRKFDRWMDLILLQKRL